MARPMSAAVMHFFAVSMRPDSPPEVIYMKAPMMMKISERITMKLWRKVSTRPRRPFTVLYESGFEI